MPTCGGVKLVGCVFGACCCHGSLSSVHGSLMSCVIDRNLRSQARQARQATRPRGQKKRSVLRFWERRFLWETAAVYVEVLFNSMIVEIKRWLVLKWVKNSNRLPVIEGLTYTTPSSQLPEIGSIQSRNSLWSWKGPIISWDNHV